MKIVISIINYRTASLTVTAICSVLDALGNRHAHVIIVDNASGDGSDKVLADWIADRGDTRLKLVLSTTNSGFSGGHNQAIEAVPNADFYLFLNSDAMLRPSFFTNILRETESDPGIGIFAPQLEWEDKTPQNSCFRFASPASELIRGAESGPISRFLQRHKVALHQPPNPSEIEWVSFACVLLRGEMVRQIGPMDEGYFLYFEDAEYCMRARSAGWGIAYASSARTVHLRGGSGPVKAMVAARERLPPYYWYSRTRFLRQTHGRFGPLSANLAWMAGRAIAQSRRLIGRSVPPARKSEWLDIWIGFLHPLRPRTRS